MVGDEGTGVLQPSSLRLYATGSAPWKLASVNAVHLSARWKSMDNTTSGAGAFGSCRKSCQKCEDCSPSDAACRARNRKAAGFPALEDLA